MISLTAAFGGLGFIFIFSFVQNTIPLRPLEYFGMAVATGLALTILLVSGLSFFGIPLTRASLSIALLSGLGVFTIRLFHKKPNIRTKLPLASFSNFTESLLPLSLFFILLLLRLIQVNNVFVPSWHDGLIHTSLLQEFAIKSSIPFDNVHGLGFHAIALVIHSFWKLPPSEAILLTGQWLSVVCGLSFYIFARRYIHNPYAAGLSFVVYSFTLLFPAHLLSWGRYPYLLGLALLPPAILTSQDWINRRKDSFLAEFVLVISLGLTHSGSFLIWFSYILVYLIKEIMSRIRFRLIITREDQTMLFRPFLLILPALVLIFSKTFDHSSIPNNLLSPVYDPDLGFGSQYVFRLFRAHDSFFLFLWAASTIWSLIRQRKLLYITLFWPLAVWILIWIRYQLIGNSILNYVDLIVFLSIPLAFSIGLLVQKLLLLLIKLDSYEAQPFFRHRLKSHLSILLMIAMLVGIFSSPLSMDQATALFTNEDMLAMSWIITNTPKDAGFLIRTTSWNNNTLIPSDGGGWITFLTGRRIIIPGMGELYDICDFAKQHDVNYIYFGKQRGNDRFDLRLSDLNADSYTVAYGTQSVEIASLRCP